jgi:uncharacterized protein YjbJ (UPF0337 family)
MQDRESRPMTISMFFKGNRNKLIGKLGEKYGISKEEAEKQADEVHKILK